MAVPLPNSPARAHPGKPEIDLFLRAVHTLLRSSGEVQLRALSETYLAMESSLHVNAQDGLVDLACVTYASLRLPGCIDRVEHVLLGQTEETFRRQGFAEVERWQAVEAPGRRRKMRYDGASTLAVFIASPSDIDDLIPMLLAFELEWNKLHARLRELPELVDALRGAAGDRGSPATVAAAAAEGHAGGDRPSVPLPMAEGDAVLPEGLLAGLGLDGAAWKRLETIWGGRAAQRLLAVAAGKKHFGLRLLGGSLNDFRRALHVWWRHLEDGAGRGDLDVRPIYFVSSNTHSLVNLLSGFARAHAPELLHFAEQPAQRSLRRPAGVMQDQGTAQVRDNFLYYVLRQYAADGRQGHIRAARTAAERDSGVTTITSDSALLVDAQVIELGKLRPERLDPRLRMPGLEWLAASDALIINVDYPLGYAAYQMLHTVSYHITVLQGLYVMGKAATLNGRVGDVLIANVFLDEHSGNTYMVDNAFIAQDVAPYLVYGTALDNQQAVAVRGTYLQNHRYLDELYTAGYTVVEMEAGPYLDALYENTFLDRYPRGQVVNLYSAPYDVGILHYASDTPFSRGHNLGAANMSYYGIDATYASAVAIVRRIFSRELMRLKAQRDGG